MIKLDATKIIVDELLNDSNVKKHVDANVYPVIARLNTTIPYIVVGTESVSIRRSKRGCIDGYTYLCKIVVVASGYARMVAIAQSVVNCLSNQEVINYSETFVEPDKFVCEITCNVDL